MQSANFSIPVSIQMCNFSMNAALFRCFACRPAAFLTVWGRQKKRNRFSSIALLRNNVL